MADSESLVNHINTFIASYRDDWGCSPSLYNEAHPRQPVRGRALHTFINSQAPALFRSHHMWGTISDEQMESVKECLEKFVLVSGARTRNSLLVVILSYCYWH